MIERKLMSGILIPAFLFVATCSFAADTTPPTGSILINGGATTTTSQAVTLTLAATDTGSGMGTGSQMQFSNDNVTWSTAEAYATTKSYTLTSGNGQKTVYVKFKDAEGNWSVAYSNSIVLDTAAPTGTVRINNNATYTNTTAVTLNLSASDRYSGLSQMQFSNDNVTWSTPQAYAATKSWSLVTGDGTKTVYVKYKDAAGNWSAAYSDTIILDTGKPTGSIKVNNNATYANTTAVTLNLSATDTGGSGLSQMRFSNDNITWSAAQAYATTKSWTLTTGSGTKTVYVKFKDAAGNWSGAYSDSIVLDVTTPTGTVSINNGAAATTSLSVTMNLSASDNLSGLSQMQFSNDNITWSAAEAYAATKPWTLSSGDGTKTVYVKYKDVAGNWSGSYSDTIILDTVPPPTILTASLQDGISGESYSENLNAVDGTPPYTWSIASQSLPNGLSLNSSTGEISGIPTVVNTFSFVVKATDTKLKTATKALSIKILPAFPPITDEELLDQTEAKAAAYFYNEALPNGFVKDADYKDFSSISATGFGLASLCVIAERYQTTPSWTISPAEARARTNQILDTCISIQNAQAMDSNNYGIAGFLYHFITQDNKRQGTCEVSTVDMSIFLAGAITAGEYFGSEVKTKAEQIYNNVNWNYFLNISKYQFSHGWFPDSGILPFTWDRPGDEGMLVSLLAISANPNNPDILKTMYSWPRAANEYGGYTVVNSYFGSLFTYVFAHCFFDFAQLGFDRPALIGSLTAPVNWWTNSVNAACANRQFCIDNASNFASYGADSWGITICEYPNGQYSDFLGSAPCESNSATPYHNGTIAPYGAISCIPFMRTSASESLDVNLAFKALRYYYQKYYYHLWGEYGPKDSFNHNREFSNAYLGIDVGPEVLMIENYRSGLIWNNFMKNVKIQAAMGKVFGNTLPSPTVLYVDASNLADTNQDGSAEHPFNVIQEAIDSGGSNIIVNIAPGQYLGTTQIISKLKITLKGIIGDHNNPANSELNTVIRNNTAMEDIGPAETSLMISGSRDIVIDNIIITGTGNYYGYYGIPCGISVSDSNGVIIKNNIIKELGRGIDISKGDGITISDNILKQNISTAMHISQGTNILISGNDIIENHSWPAGGGVSVSSDGLIIRNNLIYNNTASECGAGLLLNGGKSVEITNNIIARNYTSGGYYPGQYGGGIYCGSDDAVIANNMISENSSLHGGGIYIGAYRVALKGNIITVQFYNSGIESFADNSTSLCSLTYNDVYINYGGFPPYYDNRYVNCTAGIGSISQDPLLVVPDTDDGYPYNDDYHLQPGSPCINAGDPAAAYNDKDGTRNDMGVYGGPNSL